MGPLVVSLRSAGFVRVSAHDLLSIVRESRADSDMPEDRSPLTQTMTVVPVTQPPLRRYRRNYAGFDR